VQLRDSITKIRIQQFLITKDAVLTKPPKFQLFTVPVDDMSGNTVYETKFPKDVNEVFVAKQWLQDSGVLRLKYITLSVIYPMTVLFFFAMYAIWLPAAAFLGQFISKVLFHFNLT